MRGPPDPGDEKRRPGQEAALISKPNSNSTKENTAKATDHQGDLAGSNRLPVLAAQIQSAHAGVVAAAKTAAEKAIECGRALLEAKDLVPHGQWRNWLREHCHVSERTAQLYMKIVRVGLNSATVAEMGLKAAGEVIAVLPYPDPPCLEDPSIRRAWELFALFLFDFAGMRLEGAGDHVDWILRHAFGTPDQWLGDDGASYRRQNLGTNNMGSAVAPAWREFYAKHCAVTPEALKTMQEERLRLDAARDSGQLRRRRRRTPKAPTNGGAYEGLMARWRSASAEERSKFLAEIDAEQLGGAQQ